MFDAASGAWKLPRELREIFDFLAIRERNRGRTRVRPAQEVIHLQVPLQIPCYDLTFLAESQFEHPNQGRPHWNPTRMV